MMDSDKIEVLDTIDQIEHCQKKISLILERLMSDTENTIHYLEEQGKESVIIDSDIESIFMNLDILNDYRNSEKAMLENLKALIGEE